MNTTRKRVAEHKLLSQVMVLIAHYLGDYNKDPLWCALHKRMQALDLPKQLRRYAGSDPTGPAEEEI